MNFLRHTIRRTAAIAFVAMTLAAPLAWAKKPAVPFKAELTTRETLGYDSLHCTGPRPVNAGTTSGTGHASHLGAVTLTATDCITFGTSMSTFDRGNFILTAANGDRLTAEYSGKLRATSATSLVFTLDGGYKITGGTGRFSDAEGGGTLSGTLDTQTGQGKFIASGLLTY